MCQLIDVDQSANGKISRRISGILHARPPKGSSLTNSVSPSSCARICLALHRAERIGLGGHVFDCMRSTRLGFNRSRAEVHRKAHSVPQPDTWTGQDMSSGMCMLSREGSSRSKVICPTANENNPEGVLLSVCGVGRHG